MPSVSSTRQPDPAVAWFASLAGQAVLALEGTAMARVLVAGPALPWVWLGVPGAMPPDSAPPRGVLLRRNGTGFEGPLRCGLPFPLASESFGAVLVQHALDDDFEVRAVLHECARLLTPGGTLWLATLNPWSPYRARWARTGLRARGAGHWQASLLRAGFALNSVHLQWFGPRWQAVHGEAGVGAADRLRAGIALTVNKRVYAAIPPKPLRNLRWQAG